MSPLALHIHEASSGAPEEQYNTYTYVATVALWARRLSPVRRQLMALCNPAGAIAIRTHDSRAHVWTECARIAQEGMQMASCVVYCSGWNGTGDTD